VIVRATNSDAPGLHQRPTRRHLWGRPLFDPQLSGGCANESFNCIHEGGLSLKGNQVVEPD